MKYLLSLLSLVLDYVYYGCLDFYNLTVLLQGESKSGVNDKRSTT